MGTSTKITCLPLNDMRVPSSATVTVPDDTVPCPYELALQKSIWSPRGSGCTLLLSSAKNM